MSLPTPYYEDSAVTLYHGDCFELIPQLGAVDHVITDPPYSERTHKGARTAGDGSEKLITFAHIEFNALRSLLDSIDVARWVVMTCDLAHAAQLMISPPDSLEFIRLGVWVKPNPTPQFTGDRPGQGFEQVVILHPKGRKKWNGGGYPAVWTCNKISGRHPTEKPIELYTRFIEQFTNSGDLILDPFAGSGTTLEAAKLMGRKAIGIELDEKYCEIAANRLRQEMLV
jgi:site-specific DNA-methyltransferase (adenine-specific)